MGLHNEAGGWGSLARVMHWMVFLLLGVMVYLGLTFVDLPRGEERTAMSALHKSLGVVVLLLVILRLAWRLASQTPGDPPGTPRWQSLTARCTHAGLYLLMGVQIASGLLTTLHGGRDVAVFGWVLIGGLERDHDLHEWFEEIHLVNWQILAIVVGVHALAALYHHFVRRDGVLRRMLTGPPPAE